MPAPVDNNSTNDEGGWVLGFLPRNKTPAKKWKPLPELPYEIMLAAAKYKKEKRRVGLSIQIIEA